VKKNKIPIRCLLGLLLVTTMVTAPSGATEVRLLTIGSGSGQAGNGVNQVRLTLSPGVAGNTDPSPNESGVILGVWEILHWQFFVSPVGDELPSFTDQLLGNYPNPFNPSTQISFSLEQEAKVLIEVYDVKGRRVGTLLEETMPAGAHSFTYEPRELASGVYIVLMRAGTFRAAERILLLK
jgi:hypothetical protein